MIAETNEKKYYVYVCKDSRGFKSEYSKQYLTVTDALDWFVLKGKFLEQWFNRELELYEITNRYINDNNHIRSEKPISNRFGKLFE